MKDTGLKATTTNLIKVYCDISSPTTLEKIISAKHLYSKSQEAEWCASCYSQYEGDYKVAKIQKTETWGLISIENYNYDEYNRLIHEGVIVIPELQSFNRVL